MINVLKGDIAGLDFDILVNAANNQLSPDGGVCGSIFERAGSELIKACEKLNGCKTGYAKMTPGFNSPSQVIIHAVGPIYMDGNHNEAKLLEAAYWNSMVLAYDYLQSNDKRRISMAFPCISTERGYPHEEACHIAIKTIRTLFSKYPDAKRIDITFVCYDQDDYVCYKEELRRK